MNLIGIMFISVVSSVHLLFGLPSLEILILVPVREFLNVHKGGHGVQSCRVQGCQSDCWCRVFTVPSPARITQPSRKQQCPFRSLNVTS